MRAVREAQLAVGLARRTEPALALIALVRDLRGREVQWPLQIRSALKSKTLKKCAKPSEIVNAAFKGNGAKSIHRHTRDPENGATPSLRPL